MGCWRVGVLRCMRPPTMRFCPSTSRNFFCLPRPLHEGSGKFLASSVTCPSHLATTVTTSPVTHTSVRRARGKGSARAASLASLSTRAFALTSHSVNVSPSPSCLTPKWAWLQCACIKVVFQSSCQWGPSSGKSSVRRPSPGLVTLRTLVHRHAVNPDQLCNVSCHQTRPQFCTIDA